MYDRNRATPKTSFNTGAFQTRMWVNNSTYFTADSCQGALTVLGHFGPVCDLGLLPLVI